MCCYIQCDGGIGADMLGFQRNIRCMEKDMTNILK